MWPALYLVIVLLTTSVDATITDILEPLHSSGAEVALIFVPGARVKGEQYKKLAQTIQESSDLRIWVALTKNYVFDIVTPIELSNAIDDAIKALKQSGLESDNYVGIGHSLGGLFLRNYARDSRNQLKAIVLMASTLERNTKLSDFPVPVLTLAAELDGQTRITRVVDEYAKLVREMFLSQSALYRHPVLCIEGANHAQFASGPMPVRVYTMNPKTDVSEEDAQGKIAKYASNFVTVQFSNDIAQIKAVSKDLENHHMDSGRIFQPLLDVKTLSEEDKNGDLPWARIAQKYFAGKLADEVEVNSKVLKSSLFMYSRPKLMKIGNKVIVNTTAFIDFEWHPLDRPSAPQSPENIELKMKTKSAIKEALGVETDDVEKELNCLALNELALNVALDKASATAIARYKKRGRPIIFETDSVRPAGIPWAPIFFRSWQDQAGFHVQAAAMSFSLLNPIFPGNLYCKVMSPYRALEWVILDSLKSY